MFKRFCLVIFLALAISSCAPNPTDVAKAYKTTTETDTTAAKQAQELAQQKVEFEQRQALWQAGFEQTANALRLLIHWGGIALVVTLCSVIISTGKGVNTAVQGLGEAFRIYAITRAEVAANLIPLDAKTRQFPLLRHVHGDRYALADGNGKMVMMLDASKDADKLALLMSGMTQHDGAVAYEARLHKEDPMGVSATSQMAGALEAVAKIGLLEEVDIE